MNPASGTASVFNFSGTANSLTSNAIGSVAGGTGMLNITGGTYGGGTAAVSAGTAGSGTINVSGGVVTPGQFLVTPGTSHDTGAFACDGVRLWWERQGRAAYPNAKRLLVLCPFDAAQGVGGSDSATRHLSLSAVEGQGAAAAAGRRPGRGDPDRPLLSEVEGPPYCSKYNPSPERRRRGTGCSPT